MLSKWPITKNGGFQSSRSQEKRDFGAKNTKETYSFFKKERLFDLSRSEKRNKELYICSAQFSFWIKTKFSSDSETTMQQNTN